MTLQYFNNCNIFEKVFLKSTYTVADFGKYLKLSTNVDQVDSSKEKQTLD